MDTTTTLKLKAKEKNNNGITKQENRSIPYSARKINEKYAPLYSVLNPLTSSDSDSLKSKGARWVSAKVQINQGRRRKRNKGEEEDKNERIEKEETRNKSKTTKVLKTDS